MDRATNLDAIIGMLMAEQGVNYRIPTTLADKQRLMRALMNVRQPTDASEELLRRQDAELQAQTSDRGIVDIEEEGLVLWRGDITRLRVDAIVNAANAQMLGCWTPLHACIDNCIHSAAGIQLRLACYEQMRKQGHDESTGMAKVTSGYNLPAKHVIHTVGPIVPNGIPTHEQEEQLASCYRSCLELAEQHQMESIAFCCISTGVFHFPNERAADIAVKTVLDHKRRSLKTIVFNVFTQKDHEIYQRLLQQN